METGPDGIDSQQKCKSLWIKASVECININADGSIHFHSKCNDSTKGNLILRSDNSPLTEEVTFYITLTEAEQTHEYT